MRHPVYDFPYYIPRCPLISPILSPCESSGHPRQIGSLPATHSAFNLCVHPEPSQSAQSSPLIPSPSESSDVSPPPRHRQCREPPRMSRASNVCSRGILCMWACVPPLRTRVCGQSLRFQSNAGCPSRSMALPLGAGMREQGPLDAHAGASRVRWQARAGCVGCACRREQDACRASQWASRADQLFEKGADSRGRCEPPAP
jgi:hypothetical protein